MAPDEKAQVLWRHLVTGTLANGNCVVVRRRGKEAGGIALARGTPNRIGGVARGGTAKRPGAERQTLPACQETTRGEAPGLMEAVLRRENLVAAPPTRPPVSRPQPPLPERGAHQANSRARSCIAPVPVVWTPGVASEQILRGSDRPCLVGRRPVYHEVGDAAGEWLAETITRVEEEALTL